MNHFGIHLFSSLYFLLSQVLNESNLIFFSTVFKVLTLITILFFSYVLLLILFLKRFLLSSDCSSSSLFISCCVLFSSVSLSHLVSLLFLFSFSLLFLFSPFSGVKMITFSSLLSQVLKSLSLLSPADPVISSR